MTEERFRHLAETAIDHVRGSVRLADYYIYGYKIDLTFNSASHKEQWGTTLDFENGGEVDGHYTYYDPGYVGANGPWIVGNEIKFLIETLG